VRVLFLAHRIPYPPNKGDKIRSFHILEWLAERHEVHLGCLVDDEADLACIAHLEELLAGRVAFARIHRRLGRLRCLPGFLHRRPLSVSYFNSRRLQAAVDELLVAGDIGAIFCSCSPMAEYLFRSPHRAAVRAAVRVMDLIDVDSQKWREYARCGPWWRKGVYRYEADALARYEAHIVRAFHHVLVVSEAERELLGCQVGPSARITAMSNGVDLDYFSPARSSRRHTDEPLLVFTGVMDYWPNADGIRWFVERVLPRIRASVPAVRLLIVGSHPSAQVRRLSTVGGVTVTGFVEDIRAYVGAASVCVVPLRVARGIQNKLLEAMAMGKPVVSTPAALEGIDATPGRELLVAADEAAFAAAVIALLRDDARSAELARRARTCVERHYSWARALRPLDNIIPGQQR
jgi:polysaccharide biosynthesis protein PslH